MSFVSKIFAKKSVKKIIRIVLLLSISEEYGRSNKRITSGGTL